MPGKLEDEILNIYRCILDRGGSKVMRQQKVKGLVLHPSSLQTVFSERGSANLSRIPQDLFTQPCFSASNSQGRNWEVGKNMSNSA